MAAGERILFLVLWANHAHNVLGAVVRDDVIFRSVNIKERHGHIFEVYFSAAKFELAFYQFIVAEKVLDVFTVHFSGYCRKVALPFFHTEKIFHFVFIVQWIYQADVLAHVHAWFQHTESAVYHFAGYSAYSIYHGINVNVLRPFVEHALGGREVVRSYIGGQWF